MYVCIRYEYTYYYLACRKVNCCKESLNFTFPR